MERCWVFIASPESAGVGLLCAGTEGEVGRETELETNPVFLFSALFSRKQAVSARGFCWQTFTAMRLFNFFLLVCVF